MLVILRSVEVVGPYALHLLGVALLLSMAAFAWAHRA